jgi:hypothetical protein
MMIADPRADQFRAAAAETVQRLRQQHGPDVRTFEPDDEPAAVRQLQRAYDQVRENNGLAHRFTVCRHVGDSARPLHWVPLYAFTFLCDDCWDLVLHKGTCMVCRRRADPVTVASSAVLDTPITLHATYCPECVEKLQPLAR